MIFKEMSKYSVNTYKEDTCMNLHEECLLKYLLNPLDLFNSTELLKLNNTLIEKGLVSKKNLITTSKINYSITR